VAARAEKQIEMSYPITRSTYLSELSSTGDSGRAGLARWLAACGLAGPVMFVVAFIFAGMVRPVMFAT
jgi:hypothetical protein